MKRMILSACAMITALPLQAFETVGALVLENETYGFSVTARTVEGTRCFSTPNKPLDAYLVYECQNDVETLWIVHSCTNDLIYSTIEKGWLRVNYDGFHERSLPFRSTSDRKIGVGQPEIMGLIVDKLKAAHYSTFSFPGPQAVPIEMTFNTYGFDRAVADQKQCQTLPGALFGTSD